MSLLDDETPTDEATLINDLYELQVSLSMLIEQLARERRFAVKREVLQSLSNLHWLMAQQHPSLMRH